MKEWTWTIGRAPRLGSVSLLEAGDEDTKRLNRLGVALGFVSDLEVHPSCRGRGWAGILLGCLTKHADKNHIDLWTYVSPFGDLFPGLSAPQLIQLYERHGFVLAETPEYEHEMVRRWRA